MHLRGTCRSRSMHRTERIAWTPEGMYILNNGPTAMAAGLGENEEGALKEGEDEENTHNSRGR